MSMPQFPVWRVPFCCAAGMFNAAAQNPANPTPAAGSNLRNVSAEEIGYSVTHWTVEDGLPQRVVTSPTQTPDRCLCFGTTGGPLRFDVNWFPAFSSREIPKLQDEEMPERLCDSAGRLWIGGFGGQPVAYEP